MCSVKTSCEWGCTMRPCGFRFEDVRCHIPVPTHAYSVKARLCFHRVTVILDWRCARWSSLPSDDFYRTCHVPVLHMLVAWKLGYVFIGSLWCLIGDVLDDQAYLRTISIEHVIFPCLHMLLVWKLGYVFIGSLWHLVGEIIVCSEPN
jgi:hypothetical protein